MSTTSKTDTGHCRFILSACCVELGTTTTAFATTTMLQGHDYDVELGTTTIVSATTKMVQVPPVCMLRRVGHHHNCLCHYLRCCRSLLHAVSNRAAPPQLPLPRLNKMIIFPFPPHQPLCVQCCATISFLPQVSTSGLFFFVRSTHWS